MSHPDYDVDATLGFTERLARARLDGFELYADRLEDDPRYEDDYLLWVAALADAAQADDYELYQVYDGRVPSGCYPNSMFL